MPNRPKQKNNKRKFEFSQSVLDELLEQYNGPDDMFGSEGLLESLKARLVERALQGEMTDHLGYEKNGERPEESTNYRNGSSPKTVRTETGAMDIQVPRDRDGSFRPVIVPKDARRLEGLMKWLSPSTPGA